MKRTSLLLLVITALVSSILLGAMHPAHAAKMRVTWTPPTTNNDGTPLKDLTGYRIEWGSCKADGSFGTYQAGINVAAPASAAWIYPSGLAQVCAHVFAINSKNVLSGASNTGSAPPLPRLSQPTH